MKKIVGFCTTYVMQSFEVVERFMLRRFDTPRHPFIFIVGQPRCGSTLFQQLMGQCSNIGYISNFQAKFWKTPYFGAILANLFKPRRHDTNFESEFGITEGLWGPNEWGWFWKRILEIDPDTAQPRRGSDTEGNLKKLGQIIAALEHVYKAPVIFDNVDVFRMLGQIATKFENSLFVNISRDKLFVANSILNAKKKRFGTLEDWYGPKPMSYPALVKLQPVEQVVKQVEGVGADLNRELGKVDDDRIFNIEYLDMCSNPSVVVEEFNSFMGKHGAPLILDPQELPGSFEHRNRPELIDPKLRDQLYRLFNQSELSPA